MLLENSIPSHREEDNDGGDFILSDEGSNYDMEDNKLVNGDDMGLEGDYDKEFFSDDLEWYKWNNIVEDEGCSWTTHE